MGIKYKTDGRGIIINEFEEETNGNKSASVTGYVAVCERCKFISYKDRHVYCGQGHWYGDDDPENIPDSLEKDLWADCKDFET